MKKLKITTVMLLVIIVASSLLIYRNKVAKKKLDNSKKIQSIANKEAPKKSDDLDFSVLGDVHGDTRKLKNAIDDLHGINADMDAMVLNGDNVDQGLKIQYDVMKNTLNKKRKSFLKL